MKKYSILIVDDDKEFLSEAETALIANGYEVLTAATGSAAQLILKEYRPSVALLDKKLPDIDGQKLADEIKKVSKDTAFIIITAYGSTDSTIKALRDGMADYIAKPVSVEVILQRIKIAINSKEKTTKEEFRFKRLFKDYQESQAYTSLLLAVTPSAVFSVDKDKRVLSWNKRAEQITGFSAKEIIGKECLTFAEKPCKEKCGLYSDDVKKPVIGKECIIKTKDGRMLTISKNVDILKDINGSIVGGVESFEDITERKKAEENLIISEEKYRSLAESLEEAIYQADPYTFAVAYVNKAIKSVYGYTQEEWIKDPKIWENTLYPEDKARVLALFAEARRKKQDLVYEYRVVRKDNAIRWVEDRFSWEEDAQGKLISLNGFVTDITERKKMEEKLAESEKKYRAIFEGASEGILVVEISTNRFLYANPAICSMLGYAIEELMNLGVKDIHPKEKLEYVLSEFKAQAEGKKVLAESLPCLRKDGSIFYADIKLGKAVIYDKEVVVGFFTDVTEQNKQREENIRLSRVARDISEGVLIANVSNSAATINYANPAAEKMLGSVTGTLNGSQLNFIFSDLNPPLLYTEIEKKLSSGSRWTGEIICVRKDGTSFPAMLLADSLKSESEQVVVVVVVDITEKRLLEDELRRHSQHLEETVRRRTADLQNALKMVEEANNKLKSYDALKSKFVADVSHEISNPLAIIWEVVSNLLDGLSGNVTQEMKRTLTILKSETERLRRFTSNMLDLAKIESGRMPVNRSKVDLAGFLNEVENYFEDSFKKKNAAYVVDTKNSPPFVWADRDLLKDVFINLLSNALKYTPEGGAVSVKVAVRDSGIVDSESGRSTIHDPRSTEVEISVTDTGPGISKEEQEKIFDKFYRIFKDKQEGTGLGLSIVKEIVELHKGTIRVESEIGKGTTFIVTLPVDLRKNTDTHG